MFATSNCNASEESNAKEEDNQSNNANLYHTLWANYYQQCANISHSNDNLNAINDMHHQMDERVERDDRVEREECGKVRAKDLIDRALAKQNAKHDALLTNVTCVEAYKDEDVEEGQIPSSPRPSAKEVDNDSTPSKSSSKDSSPLTPLESSTHQSQTSRSHSRSPSKPRLVKSRSRSRSRRYATRSRSRSPSRSRRRRSRSRSPYLGPIIKDYRRGRRGYIRFPRGYRGSQRPYRNRQTYYMPYNSFSRRQEFSRSRSPSYSPKRRYSRSPPEMEKNAIISDEEKPNNDKRAETLKPSDIKLSQKKITQSFLAMLEEKQNKSKMVPIEFNKNTDISEADEAFNKQHGFVNTFNTVRDMEGRKHTLSYDLEREGWQVIDDAASESGHYRHQKNKETDLKFDDKYKSETIHKNSERDQFVIQEKKTNEADESSSSDDENKKKKKKTKKRKKRKKRKTSTSSESSESESEDDIADDSLNKKKSKKKKKLSKKKKKKNISSSSSENEKDGKHKKKKRKKKKVVSSDTESEDKTNEALNSLTNQKMIDEEDKNIISESIPRDSVKSKDKKKKRKAESSSSDSDSEKNEKKKKKKNKKKKVKKRKHHSSSTSSSSESSDSSESGQRKKKKRKKSKKRKRNKKHKRDKKSDKKEKTKVINDDNKKSKHDEENKLSEFVNVFSIGDPPVEIKWPKKIIKFTNCEPSLQYSINPKVVYCAEDFRSIKDDKHSVKDDPLFKKCKLSSDLDNNDKHNNENEKLASEYERFIGEVGAINEDSLALEANLREKLLTKQNNNSLAADKDLVTPSEKRAIEKMKKQYQKVLDDQEANRRQEELKSAPLSTYYSSKRHSKSSPNIKNDNSCKNDNISEKSMETEPFYKGDDISITISERTNKHELNLSDNVFKVEDKKKTARELLERVKQKKNSSKESNKCKSDDSSVSKRSLHIGKMKKSSKKSLSPKTTKNNLPSITTANADSTQNSFFVSKPMKLNMNYDYNWYYQYYLDNYALGHYSSDINTAAAYYAQYAMLTSYDYCQSDLANWMNSRECLLENLTQNTTSDTNQTQKSNDVLIDSNEIEKDIQTKENLSEVKVESTEMIVENISDVIENIKSEESDLVNKTDSEEPQTESLCKNSDEMIKNSKPNDQSLNSAQNIEVIVSSQFDSSNIILKQVISEKNESDSTPNMSPFCSANLKHKVKVRVTTSSQNESESESIGSPPPPPPPPPRPQMTTFTSTNAIKLPNGHILPAGTKQIVVHPYSIGDANKFTAEWYYNAFNAHNATKTSAGDTQSVSAN